MTAVASEDFPRGGVSAHLKPAKKRKREYRKDDSKDDLFQESESKRGRISKKADDGEEKAFAEVVAPGMLVLGCVCEVHDFELVVSLPNGLKGTVAITEICDAYTNLLQKLAEGNDFDLADDKSLLSLQDIFHAGSIVRCKVKEVIAAGKAKLIKLTVNPREVNSSITALKSGMVLTGCVSSCEDHGYLIDLGLKAKAFLRKDVLAICVEKLGYGKERLSVGSYLHCAVSVDDSMDKVAGESQVVKVSVDPDDVNVSLLNKSMKLNIQSLLPGSVVKATVKSILEKSLTVQLLSFTGVIQKHHLQMSMKAYEVGNEIEVAILFVNSMTKVVALTELPHLVTASSVPDKLFGSLTVGDILDDAVVNQVDKKLGVYFMLPNKTKAFATLPRLPPRGVKSLHQSYVKGSKHRCRIINFDYLSKMAFVSLKENIINLEFFSYSDVKPGALLECTVEKLFDHGASVRVSKHIRGFIPKMHLSDVPLAKPEKKFYATKKLNCKVLVVNPEKSKLLLTGKKSLVNSELPAITEYQQCRKGAILAGFVASVKPNGVVVVFFNDVKGWVPKQETSFEEIDDPRRLFFVGQVVKCRVLKSDPDEKRLILSFKMNYSSAAVEQCIPVDLVVGKVTSCVVRKLEASGLRVELLGGVLAELPKLYLSDFGSNVNQLYNAFHIGDVIQQTMVFRKKNSFVTVTNKASTIEFSLDGNLVTDFALLQPGMILPGVVKKKMHYGIFLDINGLIGLVPNKYLADGSPPDPQSLFSEGQSLMPKVTEVDKEKSRFLLSLRMSDCYHGDIDVGLNLLQNYLEEYQKILSYIKTCKGVKSELGHLAIGSIVCVKITNVIDKGVLCEMNNQVKGFATIDNMAGFVCEVGEEHEAVVLFIDPDAECIQLSLNQELVKAVKKFVDNKYSKARVGQVIKSEVHLVTADFVLVLLKGHAVGRLAFLPAKRHLNDVLEKFQYHVGQVNPVVIKRECNDLVIANLRIYENGANNEIDKTVLPAIGSVIKAKVQKVYTMQLNVTVEGVPGRVHVTEVKDDIQPGTSPFSSFSEGNELMVKVIGYREEKSHRYVSSDQAKGKRVFLECTMRPSKMSSDVIEDLLHPNIVVGDKVNAFVISMGQNCIQMQVTQTVKGTVHILNASDKPKILSNASAHFKVGCGFQTTVLGVAEDNLELAIADRKDMIKAGDVVPAIILKLIPHRGLLLQLPLRQIADVHLTQLSDEYQDFEQHKFMEHQFVRCRILSAIVGPRMKWNASLRKSKLNNVPLTIGDREVLSKSDLGPGDICRGYIVRHRKRTIFVSFSSEVTGRVKPGHLSKYAITDLKSIFHPGKVVTAKVLSVHKKHMKLSLLEKDTLVPEAIPQNVVQGLSLWTINKESIQEALEYESAVAEKSYLRLFSPSGSRKKLDPKQSKQKVHPTVDTKVLSFENFWNDKFVLPSGIANDDESDDA